MNHQKKKLRRLSFPFGGKSYWFTKLAYVTLSGLFALFSCGNDGLFGHSSTKEEARATGSDVVEYLPNRSKFLLLDGTSMQIDTAWTEVSFTFKDGKRIMDANFGYHFSIPADNSNLKQHTFLFKLLDTTNRVFTNAGADKNGLTQLYPRLLYDTMLVKLEQRNPDTSFGWLRPIVTDTIVFTRIAR